MANLNVFGSVTVSPLVNGDNLHSTLNATLPLYQTFKKGTQEFVPNWAAMTNPNRPVIFPRVYSTMEARVLPVTDVSFKYNSVAMTFGGDGLCTAPDIPRLGKVRLIDYNGSKALRIEGNIASDANNDSHTISFVGKVDASGQQINVSADITLLVEEASSNLYRLFLIAADDVIDGDETSVSVTANLYNNGAAVSSGVEYEFLKIDGTVIRAKGATPIVAITRAMVDSQLMLICKAYVGGVVVAQEQRLIWDSTDPYAVVCDKGLKVEQDTTKDETYTFSLMNQRTGAIVPGATFVINVYKNINLSDITAQFAKTNTSLTLPGAKSKEHGAVHIVAGPVTVNL